MPGTASSVRTDPGGAAVEPATVQVTALGVPIDVTGLSAEEAAGFRAAWSRCLARGTVAAGTVARITGSFDRADEHLTSTITLTAIDQLAGRLMMFHACGLADSTGATVAFIAPSGTGKTTVARTLGTGLGYVSDETIAVDEELRIVPYPKPLSVKQPEAGLPKLQLGPDSFPLGRTPAKPFLRAITLLSRHDGGGPVVLEAVPLVEAVLELTPQLSALASLDRGLVQLCRMIDACGGVTRIRYSEAAGIREVLPELSAPSGAGTDPWMALELERSDTGLRTGVRRAAVRDAVEVAGVVLVLVNTQVMELGPLGGIIWELAAGWTSRDEVLAGVVERIGGHPDAAQLIGAALDELVAKGVLEQA
ncbi:hypothetical protein [Arthrobacter sp. A2-55]|uniref:hypothetical protein n=1 Tax=Arthrobacter sp. A2-55 TaxID=2897337 RepID=UPI0021CDB6DD|nr:hypothetical protein [Arthrobacter sp. A2-55]MCU6481509.1 hypothetical protein [Arthrobacter sp. A2-55]